MAVCSGFIEPLNLECILVNMFAGNIAIFMAIAFIAVAALAARFRMPKGIALMMMALFIVLFANLMLPFYFIVILIVGVTTFVGIGRLIKQ